MVSGCKTIVNSKGNIFSLILQIFRPINECCHFFSNINNNLLISSVVKSFFFIRKMIIFAHMLKKR